MNIGFYGHSNCAYRSPDSFLDLVATHYNGKIVNKGCKQGSEERILFELKKTKHLDVAVIFHCHHNALFIPDSDRDVHAIDVTYDRANNLFHTTHLDTEFEKENSPKFINLFKNDDNLLNVIDIYKNYLYHQDLELNRYYGALMQIDQYLTYKKNKAIHVIDKRCAIPLWFKFNGYVDESIMQISEQEVAKNPFFANCISKHGNKLIADKIIEIIESYKY